MSEQIIKKCAICDKVFKNSEDILNNASRIRICSAGNLWFNCTCESTLFLRHGSFEWFSIESLLSSEAKKIYRSNKEIGKIPKIHSNIMSLQEAIENPKTSFEDIKKELELNPSIGVLILSMASNLNPQGEEIKELKHAISLLGRTTLSNLVLSSSLVSMKLQSKLYQIQDYWQEALITGSISKVIYTKFGYDYADDLIDRVYLSGCFCQIGKLMGAILFPEKIDQIYNMVSNPTTMTTWEKAVVTTNTPSMNHLAEIAAVLWGLPTYVKNVCLYFNNILDFESPPGTLELLESIQFANIIFHWLNSSPHLIDLVKLKHFQRRLNLDDSGMENLVSEVSQHKVKIDAVIEQVF